MKAGKISRWLALAGLLAMSLTGLALTGSATTIDFRTGWDYNPPGTYPIGVADEYWTVTCDPDPGTTEPRPAWVIQKNSAWQNPIGLSQWISSYPTNLDDLNGTYCFEFCFHLAQAPTSASIYLQMRADDSAVVYLNGNWIGKATWSSFNDPTPQLVTYSGTAYFQAGNNIVEVDVVNTNQVAMGFNIEGTLTANVVVDPGCFPAVGRIEGFKWDDGPNPNCIKDQNESKIQNWEIDLSTGDKTWTDNLGNYYFNNLSPGTYTVTETQQSGWYQHCPATSSYTVYVGPNQTVTGLNFGNIYNDTLGSIEGYKFNDYDCDGEWDTGEPGIANWPVSLWQGTTCLFSTLTAPNGYYIFSPLYPGTYVVNEPDPFPTGWQETFPYSVFYPGINLSMGQHLTGYIFGNNDTCVEATRWDTLSAGTVDDFQGPEPSHWGAGLTDFMSGHSNSMNFDEVLSDQYFGYTYEHQWAECCIEACTLTVTLQATGSGGCDNDALALGHYGSGNLGTIWWIYLSDLLKWAKNDPNESWDCGDGWTFTLDLGNLKAIPNGHGYNGDILAALKAGYLDLVIQDDTGCDWLQWKLWVCCPDCCDKRGDINNDGTGPDIADLVYLVTYMFGGGPEPPCMAEADVNGNGTGPDIADLVYLVTYMFGGGPAPVSCP